MTDLYPLKLSPVFKSAIWGGQRLKTAWQKRSDLEAIAETWELTVREKENNFVQNGPFLNKKLADVLRFWGKEAIGTLHGDDRFPLLIKFIDAADKLSVQVHPDDTFAAAHEGDKGKTEAWFVVEASKGASILMGLADGATKADLADAVTKGDPEALLRRVEVKKGDVFFIPAGMPHAIGEGMLIAEVQQNCDLTYRLFDYNRRDKNGNLRELHIDKALQVARPFSAEQTEAIQFSRPRLTQDTIVRCPYFSLRHVKLAGTFTEQATPESFVSLLFLSGEGRVIGGESATPYQKGDSFFLPAQLGEYRIEGTGEVLITTL